MNRQPLRRQTRAILLSILLPGLGFLSVWVARESLELAGDAVLVTVLLLPFIVYMISSGQLSELRGPGGLVAKFASIAEQSVEPETIEASVPEMSTVKKRALSELPGIISELDESKPIILTLKLGTGGQYGPHALLKYLDALSRFRTFKFVVILDDETKFVAYIPPSAMLQILRMQALGHEFVSIINEGKIRELRRYPGVVASTISTKSTNVDALEEMTAQNLEALVVIDEDRRLRGVVERGQLLSKLLLGMAR